MVGMKRVSAGNSLSICRPSRIMTAGWLWIVKDFAALISGERVSVRGKGPNGAAEQCIGEHPAGIEIEMGLEALKPGEVTAHVVVFGGDRDEQTAGDGNAKSF